MSARLLTLRSITSSARTASPLLSSLPTSPHFRSNIRKISTAIVDSDFISAITAAEKSITNSPDPVKDGPTAQAQSHAGKELDPQVLRDIKLAERRLTNLNRNVANGPAAVAQSLYSLAIRDTEFSTATLGARGIARKSSGQGESHSGVLDSETISRITEKEKEITGREDPVRRGPTAKAQQHVGEPIDSGTLHDITEGEKKITGGERVKGGPTSQAQSELAKSRQQ